MTTDQVRELFSGTMQFCIDSFRSQKPFEQMPGLADRLAKTPVVRHVGAGEPELYEHWHAIGQYAVRAHQWEDGCSVLWDSKRVPFDAAAEYAAAETLLKTRFPTAVEQPFFTSRSVAYGRRFAAVEGERNLPIVVYVSAADELIVSLNGIPYPDSPVKFPFVAFERECVWPLYIGRTPAPAAHQLAQKDASIAPATGLTFYGNPRYQMAGFNAADPKVCGRYLPNVSPADAAKALPAEMWGVTLSIVKPAKPGVVVVARLP